MIEEPQPTYKKTPTSTRTTLDTFLEVNLILKGSSSLAAKEGHQENHVGEQVVEQTSIPYEILDVEE